MFDFTSDWLDRYLFKNVVVFRKIEKLTKFITDFELHFKVLFTHIWGSKNGGFKNRLHEKFVNNKANISHHFGI